MLLIVCGEAHACVIPAQGTYWTHDELIDHTSTILLVTPESMDHGSKFKILETLKGIPTDELEWVKFHPSNSHRSEDFDTHQNPDFWKDGDDVVVRATYYPGACTLQFTFVPGEKYLIFRESPGHPHSAEIIKSTNDKWYQYVKARINQKYRPE